MLDEDAIMDFFETMTVDEGIALAEEEVEALDYDNLPDDMLEPSLLSMDMLMTASETAELRELKLEAKRKRIRDLASVNDSIMTQPLSDGTFEDAIVQQLWEFSLGDRESAVVDISEYIQYKSNPYRGKLIQTSAHIAVDGIEWISYMLRGEGDKAPLTLKEGFAEGDTDPLRFAYQDNYVEAYADYLAQLREKGYWVVEDPDTAFKFSVYLDEESAKAKRDPKPESR
jgi:hypothetical protein